MSGSDNSGTITWERTWESLASMEAAYGKTWNLPEVKALLAKHRSVLVGERTELYGVLDID
ncbi:MAG: hypothetical protein NTX54_05620 [Chloroflexi bacterium]|nr:hypothetical protein [Chloroflexota bacterium]